MRYACTSQVKKTQQIKKVEYMDYAFYEHFNLHCIIKNPCTPMFIAAQFTIAKYWKQPKCPSANEWIQNYGTFT